MVKLGNLFRKAEIMAMKSTLIAGVITHLFALTNVLHNYDSVGLQPYGYGTGIESGRWMLSLVAWRVIDWFGQYNLPLINGLLMILLLAAAAAVFVSVYGLNEKSALCVGVIFATAPAVTSTMFFSYTALIRYSTGGFMARIYLPAGAIAYAAVRKKLFATYAELHPSYEEPTQALSDTAEAPSQDENP